MGKTGFSGMCFFPHHAELNGSLIRGNSELIILTMLPTYNQLQIHLYE